MRWTLFVLLVVMSTTVEAATCRDWWPNKNYRSTSAKYGSVPVRPIPGEFMNDFIPGTCWKIIHQFYRPGDAYRLLAGGKDPVNTMRIYSRKRDVGTGAALAVIEITNRKVGMKAAERLLSAHVVEMVRNFKAQGAFSADYNPSGKLVFHRFGGPEGRDFGKAYIIVATAPFGPGDSGASGPPRKTGAMAAAFFYAEMPTGTIYQARAWQGYTTWQPFSSSQNAVVTLRGLMSAFLLAWQHERNATGTAAARNRIKPDLPLSLKGECASAYRKFKERRAKYKALALTPDGEWCGWAFGRSSQSEVDAKALGFCRNSKCVVVMRN